MFLALVLAAGPAVELHALRAGLLSDDGRPLGYADDVRLVARGWPTQTLMRATHESTTIDFEAFVDVSRDGTFVEVEAKRDVVLSVPDGWTVVLREKAKVPLLGRLSEGLRVGFFSRSSVVVPVATVPDVERPVPEASWPKATCVVQALHARADARSARWKPSSVVFDVFLGPMDAAGWAPAFALGEVVRVHGFAHKTDVVCDVGTGGGLELTGMGGARDGSILAQEGTVPAGTKVFWSKTATDPFATLKVPTRGLRDEKGLWRFPHLRSGRGEVSLRDVVVKVEVALAPMQQHGVGSSLVSPQDWPRLRATGK